MKTAPRKKSRSADAQESVGAEEGGAGNEEPEEKDEEEEEKPARKAGKAKKGPAPGHVKLQANKGNHASLS